MAEYYNDRSLLAGVSAPQINVGDITKAGSIVAQSLKSQRDKEIENARLDREAQKFGWEQNRFERENLINQRQDKEYDRQQNALQASKDIARELIDTPYAAKFGGAENMEKVDADVQAAVQKRALTPAEDVRLKSILEKKDQGGMLTTDEEGLVDKAKKSAFTPEEAAGIQKTYELNRPYKEDAQKNIIARLMQAGATSQQAAAEAEGLTRGLLSRADEQNYLDQQRKVQQEYNDNAAKANLEMLKANIDIGKANQTGDVHKAEIQQKYQQLMFGGAGSGSGGGSGEDKITSGGYGGISQLLKKVGPYDAGEAQDAVTSNLKKGYTDQQIFTAMKNAIDEEPTALLFHDNKVDFGALNRRLAQMTPGTVPFNDSTKIRDVSSNITAKDLLSNIVPYQRAGYDPDRMEAALRANAPTVFGGRTASNVVSNPSISGVDVSRTLKGKVHVDGVPDSLLANEGATVNKDGMYTISPDVDSKGINRGRVIGYGYNLEQNRDSIKSDFQKAGIPDYKAKEALDPNGNFTLSKDETDKLAKVVYGREGVDKATKVVPGYKELTPMMKEIANDMAYRGDLKPGENSYRGELPKVLATGDINQVYKYVNEMNVPQEVKTRLGNILTTERSRDEVLGPKSTGSVLAQPQRDLIKQGRFDEVMSGMKRQNDREDWSTGVNGLTKEDLDLIAKEDTITKQKSVIDDITKRYQENNGGLMDSQAAIMKLQRDGHMTRQEAEKVYKKIVQESVKGPAKNTGTDWNY